MVEIMKDGNMREKNIESIYPLLHTYDPQPLTTEIRIVFDHNVCWLLLSFEDIPVTLRF